jgi:hypothetical protein
MFVCCECCVLLGRGLCDGLITRPEESYGMWRVVVCDLETSKMRRLKPATGLWKIQPKGCNAKKTNKHKCSHWRTHQDHKDSLPKQQHRRHLARKILKVSKIIIDQNYFQLLDKPYVQTEGLAMGAPTSSIFLENSTIYNFLLN